MTMESTCRDVGFWGGTLGCSSCALVTAGCMRLVSLTAGAYHACGLDSFGQHWCWGEGTKGQLGNATLANASIPVPVVVPGGATFSQIQTGGEHSCALDQTGDAWCWGDGTDGQLGNNDAGDMWSAPQPVNMPTGVTFTALSLGFGNTCALDTLGSAWCWGYGNSGEIGNGSTASVAVPAAVTMPTGVVFVELCVGSSLVCALDAGGTPWCWGNNSPACSFPVTQPSAQSLPAGRTFQHITVGGSQACAIDDLGAAWCWGSDQWGQLGNGAAAGSCSPTAVVMPTATFSQLGAGSQHGCGLAPNGAVYCWGRNSYGEVGDGTLSIRDAPVAALASASFSQLAVGHLFNCALSSQGVAWCWGSGQYGSIGNGTTADALRPTETSEP